MSIRYVSWFISIIKNDGEHRHFLFILQKFIPSLLLYFALRYEVRCTEKLRFKTRCIYFPELNFKPISHA